MYDVTKFIDEVHHIYPLFIGCISHKLQHPGGDEVILSEAGEYLSYTRPHNYSPCLLSSGKDATEAFEDVGHSDEARGLLPGMRIGEFEKGPKVRPSPPVRPYLIFTLC